MAYKAATDVFSSINVLNLTILVCFAAQIPVPCALAALLGEMYLVITCIYDVYITNLNIREKKELSISVLVV